MASIQFEKVVKVYDGQDTPVIPDLNLTINDKEFVILVGPSGCGKSTTLRMIAGLEDITHGTLKIDGKKVNDVPARDRDIAMVFQSYALYPNMTVYKNIAFPLKVRKLTFEEKQTRLKDTVAHLFNYGINESEANKIIEEIRQPGFDKKAFINKVQNAYSLDTKVVTHLIKKVKSSKYTKEEIDEKVKAVCKILNLEGYLDRKPANLSGGQRQRVALGRAMVRNPKVFLLDEPLSNLDAKLRAEMRVQISLLHKRLDTTFVYVTHDQTEAMTIADRIAVFNKGVVQQFDTPRVLYEHPVNKFVAGFIGSPEMNFINAKVSASNKGFILNLEGQKIVLQKHNKYDVLSNYIDKEVCVGIRPEGIILATEENVKKYDASFVRTISVKMCEYLGSESFLYFDIGSIQAVAKIPARFNLTRDAKYKVILNPDKFYIFDNEDEKTIVYPKI